MESSESAGRESGSQFSSLSLRQVAVLATIFLVGCGTTANGHAAQTAAQRRAEAVHPAAELRVHEQVDEQFPRAAADRQPHEHEVQRRTVRRTQVVWQDLLERPQQQPRRPRQNEREQDEEGHHVVMVRVEQHTLRVFQLLGVGH